MAFLFVVVVFGVVVIGHTPKWPIYVTILAWWAFIIYTTISIDHPKDASISGGKALEHITLRGVELDLLHHLAQNRCLLFGLHRTI